MEQNIWHLAEEYVHNRLSGQELNELKQQLSDDTAFAAEFNECVNLVRALHDSSEEQHMREMLKDIHKDVIPVSGADTRTIPLRKHYWRIAAIAAGIAMLTSLTTFWAVQHNNKRIASQYSLLRRDLEKYKRSQNKIIMDIQKASPQTEARYSGTGFAITNDGYLVTNYHVIAGADSVYVQHKDGEYYKAHPVSFDEQSDVVILKVEDENFKFAKWDIPYTIASDKRKLGSKVYTLGFPQDEIVYNEGYISSKNGYNGDSMQYRLEIPAGPGQSGAPVVDGKGQVIGIITGKESESLGTTFAVCSDALLELVNGLPKENNIRLQRTNRLYRLSREQQIERLEYYTCSIKVYKQ